MVPGINEHPSQRHGNEDQDMRPIEALVER